MRERLPDERPSMTRHFHLKYAETDENTGKVLVKDLKFYITAGMYPDNRLGEVFIRGDKMGSLLSGSFDALATMISIALQHGVPMSIMTDKLRRSGFGPSGRTVDDPEYRSCTSVFDLVAQYLETTFPGGRWQHKNDRNADVQGQGKDR